ncbi:RDD family protein [Rhizobium paknamense]|uniref:RDD family membrane protein YckC n=1 Tax=Rhizobium paknamense TaxID=1206817 RepID=A0ABU0I7A5_9HYPH|nr:RDD family protein [Rhizobium paknamense]MDQ0454092.1 putative RDD family membrane protein YckC [Rhizobium paknamense]
MSYEPQMTTAVPSDWRAYSGVLSRRVFAFMIDYVLVGLLMLVAIVAVFFLGIITLGLGWLLYPILFFLVAGLYFGLSMASPAQATPGMRAMGIALIRLDGGRIDFVTAIAHLALFWILNSVLTPLILLAGLFIERSRLIHDLLLGTAAVRVSPGFIR